ncbi:IS66 family transposase [Saccharopolyspora pogona]|uniref:IS66 family transposase n=1 Tax=Saccharopolyspora pogona TaxID=333966 RepID=UPI001CC2280E|nr:IS66 family transposase [Saccharopolyspora pogona]
MGVCDEITVLESSWHVGRGHAVRPTVCVHVHNTTTVFCQWGLRWFDASSPRRGDAEGPQNLHLDLPAAKGKRDAQRSQRVRSKDRKPGGRSGRTGSGLVPALTPDRTETAQVPQSCSGCGSDLAGGADAGLSWTQIWDIPPVRLEKVHYLLPRRRCACCGKTTTAVVPFGQAGAVVYGPNVNAAAILLASAGKVPVEWTAMLMAALLASSTGFVARAHQRFAERLERARFDQAMRSALAAEPVLCADETPVNVARRDTDERGAPVPGSPHVVTVRTPEERLVWYRALPRTKVALRTLGLFSEFTGYLVRDDYTAWHQFDHQIAGVQQCVAHLFRHLQGVLDLHPTQQGWADTARDVLREAHTAVQTAKTTGSDRLDPVLLADLRARYDKVIAWGQTTNRLRDWHKGNHPGYTLAKRLADKADQVWLFTTVLSVPWTDNASEQALKSPKMHQKVSGYWHTLTTLGRFCRVRSYLTSATNHGLRAIDAIHAALTGNPWMPQHATT